MSRDFDPRWYDLLLEEATARLPGLPSAPGPLARHLTPHVVALSKGLTRDRALPGARYLDTRELAIAYLLYFLPANAWKGYQLLLPYAGSGLLPTTGSLHVTDVGCGQGTLFWATLAVLVDARARRHSGAEASGTSPPEPASSAPLTVHYRGIDHSPQALDLLASLARRLENRPALIPGISLRLELRRDDLLRPSALPEPGQHLILAGNVLNELASDAADPFPRRLAWGLELQARLAPGGLLLVLEPALKATASTLGRLRDRLLELPDLQVLSPCTHRAPCPLVAPGAPSNQWCHQEIDWERPSWVASIDQLTGLRKDRLALSHLLVRRTPEKFGDLWHGGGGGTPGSSEALGMHYRALSPALKARGTVTVHLCGPDGFQEALLLTRHLNPENAPFTEVGRGDDVVLEGATLKGKQLRIDADTHVRIRR